MSAETRAVVADVAAALQAIADSHYEPRVIADRMADLTQTATGEQIVVVVVTLGAIVTECTRRMYGVPKDHAVQFTTLRIDAETGDLEPAELPPLADMTEGARAAVNAARVVAFLGEADVEGAGAIVAAAVNAGPRAVMGMTAQLIQLLHGAEHATGVVPSFIKPA
jgi:hypothetical protein